MPPQQGFSAKTTTAVLYLCNQSMNDPNFNVGKLTRLLYFADAEHYQTTGKTVTNLTYLAFPEGPYPERWYALRQEMEERKEIETAGNDPNHPRGSYVIIPLWEADTESLDATELQTLERQLERFSNANSAGIAEESRRELTWRTAEYGEPLDLELAAFSAPPLSINGVLKAREIAQHRAENPIEREIIPATAPTPDTETKSPSSIPDFTIRQFCRYVYEGTAVIAPNLKQHRNSQPPSTWAKMYQEAVAEVFLELQITDELLQNMTEELGSPQLSRADADQLYQAFMANFANATTGDGTYAYPPAQDLMRLSEQISNDITMARRHTETEQFPNMLAIICQDRLAELVVSENDLPNRMAPTLSRMEKQPSKMQVFTAIAGILAEKSRS